MAKFVGSIEPYVPGNNFESYQDRLAQFFAINGIKDELKVPLFITILGADNYEVLKSLTVPETPSKLKFDELMKHLSTHFQPKTNKRTERYRFYKAVQENGESISDFIIKLKLLAQTCQFGDVVAADEGAKKYASSILDDTLVDKFIIGLRNERIQQQLLMQPYSFEKCCELAQNMELSEKESKSLHTYGGINPIKNGGSSTQNNNSNFYKRS